MAVLTELEERSVREALAGLERPVELVLAVGPEPTPLAAAGDVDFAGEAEALLEAVAGLSPLVSTRLERDASGLERFPAILFRPEGEEVGIRYDGVPRGYELTSLVGGIREVARSEALLAPASLEALLSLERDVTLEVFVTPTCPHCPRAVLLAYRFALASPRVSAAGVEATEFPAAAEEAGVWAVPKIVADGVPLAEGALSEAALLQRLLLAAV